MAAPTAHQVIFINGPRYSGKDTAATHITANIPRARHRKFAGALKKTCAEMFQLPRDMVASFEAHGSSEKLRPRPELMGMSWVEALIWLSEEVMKPKFGKDIFGRILLQEMQQPHGTVLTVISDSGFLDEAVPLIKFYGAENCHHWHLKREGCSFMGDSRDYWQHPSVKPSVLDNAFELKMFRLQVLRRANKILGIEKEYNL